MDFKPMADRVLVQQDDTETKTASGFFIPDSSVEKANKGTVLAIGPGKTTKDGVVIPMPVEINDKVMFAPGAGIKVKVNGEEMLVLKEEELIAIVE
jgi:chaperonin GroES